MAKAKTSKKQKNFSRGLKPLILVEHRPEDFDFSNSTIIREILSECLLTNDLDTFQDILLAFIRSQSKTRLAMKTKLGRQTLYDLMKDPKEFNPEWETLRALLKAI